MKRVSIIIPMYKVEPYVERCIRSIEAQDISHDEVEIICVNDGSPDNCHGVVSNLQKEFDNIILIDQDNQGVSVARNNGVSVATGHFLLMVDPDDYVLERSLKSILDKAESNDLDALYLGFEILSPEDRSVWQTDYSGYSNIVYDGIEGYYTHRRKDTRDPDHSWAIIYRAEFIKSNRLLYPKGVPYLEDGLFLVKVFCLAKRVGFHELLFYKRTIRPGSATNSDLFYSQRAVQGFIAAANDLKEFGGRINSGNDQKGLINHGIADFVLLSLFPLIRLKSFKYFFLTCRRLTNEGYKTLDTFGVVEPYLSYAKLYNISPILFALMYGKDLLSKKIHMIRKKHSDPKMRYP
jgi:glycosyltransferase involved in cell wall biosynthesis